MSDYIDSVVAKTSAARGTNIWAETSESTGIRLNRGKDHH